jgi:hypothetical protein
MASIRMARNTARLKACQPVKEKFMTPVETLTELFGSRGALADAAGVDRAMVTRWAKPAEWKAGGHVGNGGRVPPRHNRAIIAAAVEKAQSTMHGIDVVNFVDAVTGCLDPATCPTCGQPIDDGRVL